MKHQYEDYRAFLNKEISSKQEALIIWERKKSNGVDTEPFAKQIRIQLASLLANKATLERHKGRPSRQSDFAFPAETEEIRAKQEALRYCCVCRTMTCPSLLDVTNPLDEVMG